MEQDDVIKKPNSLVADFTKIYDTMELALKGIQIRPLFIQRYKIAEQGLYGEILYNPLFAFLEKDLIYHLFGFKFDINLKNKNRTQYKGTSKNPL